LALSNPNGTMAIVSEDPSSSCYDIKSADLSLVALVLKSTDMSLVQAALKRQMDESPGFFDQDPVLIDVSALDLENDVVDLKILMEVLREHAMLPLAIKGAKGAFLQQAKGLGLVDASDARIRRSVQLAEASAEAPDGTAPHVFAPPQPPVALEALVIDKPLRSGQQVYAKGRDLIVMAMVNAGAEVIADGHIHVYASLRGKAIAGARGNAQAKIFALVMEPELISIAGVYRTSENPLSKDVLGKTAQVSLQSGPEGDKLLIKPLNP
jgi:septum site-determining protein MinC